MDSKISLGTPSNVEVCISNVIITNKFKEMMMKAHRAQEKVLQIRAQNLDEISYYSNKSERDEFEKIFGMKWDTVLERYNKTAKMVMLDGVERMKKIHREMIRLDENGVLTCYYINNTICGNFSAKVNSMIDRNYQVYIAGKFGKMKLLGRNSQVSTLCHEMSHFCMTGEGGMGGGMNTQDMNAQGQPAFLSESAHLDAAKIMVSRHDQRVFNSAYNIEKYFELTLDVSTFAEVKESVEQDMKKELRIIVDNSPPPSPK